MQLLLSISLAVSSQSVETKHRDARIFIGAFGGQMVKVDSRSLNKTSLGVMGDFHTGDGVTWRGLIFGAKEESSALSFSRSPTDLPSLEIFQVGVEMGPSLRLVNFGKRGDWNLGGGILADYAEAKWVSEFEYLALTDESVIINRKASFVRVRPLVESNINFKIKEKWKIGLSMAVALAFSEDSRGGQNSGNGRGDIYYRRADVQSSGDYTRFGFSIFYRVAQNSQL